MRMRCSIFICLSLVIRGVKLNKLLTKLYGLFLVYSTYTQNILPFKIIFQNLYNSDKICLLLLHNVEMRSVYK